MSAVGKKGAAEARAAMTELIAELDRTRKEFAKTTLQLTHLETTVQHLKDAEAKKDSVIAHLEGELERRETSYRQEVAILQEEAKTKTSTMEHRMKFLEMEVSRLTSEVEVASGFEKENRQLRDTVLENQSTIEKLHILNEELRHRAKDDAREHAQQLETEFKRRLADSEKRFRAEAYRALSEEAKIALQGNDHLQTVLQRQNDTIEAVLLKCKQLEQSHSKISAEQDLSSQAVSQHVAEIQRLKKQLGDSKTRNTQLEDALKQRRVERASLELLFIEYEGTRKQLAKEGEKCRRAQREAERWRNRAVQLTNELGDDKRASAEAKLDAIAAHGDHVEQHLAKTKARNERKQRERLRNQAGAELMTDSSTQQLALTAGRQPTNQPQQEDTYSQASDEEEIGADGTAGGGMRSQTLNPMEILSMWNINFESWRPPTTEGGEGVGEDGAPASPMDGGHEGLMTGDPDRDSPISVNDQRQQPAQHSALAHSSGTLPPVERGNSGGAHRQALNPVRPPAKVDDRRKIMDEQLSVLSRPKPIAQPPNAQRHFAGHQQNAANRKKQQMASVGAMSELSVVSHGEFKVSKRNTDPTTAARFITP